MPNDNGDPYNPASAAYIGRAAEEQEAALDAILEEKSAEFIIRAVSCHGSLLSGAEWYYEELTRRMEGQVLTQEEHHRLVSLASIITEASGLRSAIDEITGCDS